ASSARTGWTALYTELLRSPDAKNQTRSLTRVPPAVPPKPRPCARADESESEPEKGMLCFAVMSRMPADAWPYSALCAKAPATTISEKRSAATTDFAFIAAYCKPRESGRLARGERASRAAALLSDLLPDVSRAPSAGRFA